MNPKTLIVETTKGTKKHVLAPNSQGFDVQKVTGFFGSEETCWSWQ